MSVFSSVGPPLKLAAEKIISFRCLKSGWHYGHGSAPSESTIQLAITYLRYLSDFGFPDLDAFPGPEGEIMISGYFGSHCVDVTIMPNGLFTLLHQVNNEDEFYKENIPSAWAYIILGEIAEKCTTYGSSIRDISTIETENSKISPSRTPVMGQVFLLFKSNVSPRSRHVSAITSANTIPVWGANRQFSGYSTNQFYNQIGQ